MQENRTKIQAAIEESGLTPNYENVSRLLPDLISNKKLMLNMDLYIPNDDDSFKLKGLAKYMIYDNPDPENPLSIWIFAFAEKQKTCIHDHRYRGTVIVLQNAITEKTFHEVHTDSYEKLAKLKDRQERPTLHCTTDNLDLNEPHQLKRTKMYGPGISLTLHIYNMHAYEKEGVYKRNVNTMFNRTGKIKEVFRDDSQMGFGF